MYVHIYPQPTMLFCELLRWRLALPPILASVSVKSVLLGDMTPHPYCLDGPLWKYLSINNHQESAPAGCAPQSNQRVWCELASRHVDSEHDKGVYKASGIEEMLILSKSLPTGVVDVGRSYLALYAFDR